jgi:hypothetical protein
LSERLGSNPKEQRLVPRQNAGGLAIGILMLLLALTGLLEWLGRVVPKTLVRGIQFGLGAHLATLALKDPVPADDWPGYALAAASFAITLA